MSTKDLNLIETEKKVHESELKHNFKALAESKVGKENSDLYSNISTVTELVNHPHLKEWACKSQQVMVRTKVHG